MLTASVIPLPIRLVQRKRTVPNTAIPICVTIRRPIAPDRALIFFIYVTSAADLHMSVYYS